MFIASDNTVARHQLQIISNAGYDPLVSAFTLDEVGGKSVKGTRDFTPDKKARIQKINTHNLRSAVKDALNTTAVFDHESPDNLGSIWNRCEISVAKDVASRKFLGFIELYNHNKKENKRGYTDKMYEQLKQIKDWLADTHQLDCKINELHVVIFGKENNAIYESFKSKFFRLEYDQSQGKTFKVGGSVVHNKLDINDIALIMTAYEHQCPLMTTNIDMENQAKSSFATYYFSSDLLFIDANEINTTELLSTAVNNANTTGEYNLVITDTSPKPQLFGSPQTTKPYNEGRGSQTAGREHTPSPSVGRRSPVGIFPDIEGSSSSESDGPSIGPKKL